MPKHFLEDSREGEELLNYMRNKGYFIEEAEPNVLGFNYARVIILPKKSLNVFIQNSIKREDFGDSFLNLSKEIYTNLVDSFKSSAWCFSLLKNNMTGISSLHLKKIRSAEPALHEDNPFNEYKMFNVKQDLNLYDVRNAQILDFYVDFCRNINPLDICQYSLFSKPHMLENRKIESIGLGYRLFLGFDHNDEIKRLKLIRTVWKDFNPVESENLSYYQILLFNKLLREYTLAALLAKEIKEGRIKV